jgi:hypothetical protein
MKADIVVFDPARVRDTATLDDPKQYPAEGIPIVIVNGEIVFENGAMTAARPGRVLYGPAAGSRPEPQAPAAANRPDCWLMEWSGRAPALPARDAGMGRLQQIAS